MLHQQTILTEAARHDPKKNLAAFDAELDDLYGSAFTSLTADPVPPQRVRGGRKWVPIGSYPAAKQLHPSGQLASQMEQRLVDVTLRDLLHAIRVVPVARKAGWQELVGGLTSAHHWTQVADQLDHLNGKSDAQSGYFWASLLAATASCPGPAAPTTAAISAAVKGASPRFEQTRHPRATSGNTVKQINEMQNAPSVRLAADIVSSAWAASRLAGWERHLIACVTGSVISADLWRHPAGVRWLLLPAVRAMRARFSTAFSLDAPGCLVEDAIDSYLGAQWREPRRDAW